MPIIDIEIVLKPNEPIPKEIVPELADQLGEIFDSPKGGTWVKVNGLDDHQYHENGRKEEGVYPIFVSVLKSRLPPAEDMQNEVKKITEAVAHICKRSSENVHVIYEPEGRGRIAFGGKLVP